MSDLRFDCVTTTGDGTAKLHRLIDGGDYLICSSRELAYAVQDALVREHHQRERDAYLALKEAEKRANDPCYDATEGEGVLVPIHGEEINPPNRSALTKEEWRALEWLRYRYLKPHVFSVSGVKERLDAALAVIDRLLDE